MSRDTENVVLSVLWDDLQPIAVRVCDKIDAHLRILKDDAAHLLMQGMRSGVIIRLECQMELFLSDVVLLGMVSKPVKPLQLQKAVLLMEVTELGMVSEPVKPLQP